MFNPLFLYRISRFFFEKRIKKIPEFIRRINIFFNGCDICANTTIGKNVRFMHFGFGVAINPKTDIGNNVIIMPQVIIGQNIDSNSIKKLDKIVIEDNVMLGAGAKIIATGNLTIGKNSTIGANAVVTKDVPAFQVWAGIPARFIKSTVNL
jgi:serine O-acetyltransferase